MTGVQTFALPISDHALREAGARRAQRVVGLVAARVERRHDTLLESIKARATADVETTRKNEQDIQEGMMQAQAYLARSLGHDTDNRS